MLGIRDKAGMQWTASGDPHPTGLRGRINQHNQLPDGTAIQRIVARSGDAFEEDNLLYGTLTGRPVKFWPIQRPQGRKPVSDMQLTPGLATRVKIHR